METKITKKVWGFDELTTKLEALEMLDAEYTFTKVLGTTDSPVSLFEVTFSFPEVEAPVFEYDE